MKCAAIVLLNLITTLIASAHGISEADQQVILEGGNLEYIKLGGTHILTGFDHLLFLFGVIYFLTKFKGIVKFITAGIFELVPAACELSRSSFTALVLTRGNANCFTTPTSN